MFARIFDSLRRCNAVQICLMAVIRIFYTKSCNKKPGIEFNSFPTYNSIQPEFCSKGHGSHIQKTPCFIPNAWSVHGYRKTSQPLLMLVNIRLALHLRHFGLLTALASHSFQLISSPILTWPAENKKLRKSRWVAGISRMGMVLQFEYEAQAKFYIMRSNIYIC